MKYIAYIALFLLFQTAAFTKALIIDTTTSDKKLLLASELYLDTTKKLEIKDILQNDFPFKKVAKDSVSFGYSPQFNVWIKFSLYNNSNNNITKLIEYENPLTTHVEFYDPSQNYTVQKEGLFFQKENSTSLNPVFEIKLEPYQTKTYYIKASSYITTLIVSLNLWEPKDFYPKEIKHQIILSLFFGAMFILSIYNLFIFFFTKDISYLYYVAYIAGLIIHQLFYVGIAQTYFFTPPQMEVITEFAALIVALPVFALGLFTKRFLNTTQYKLHDSILNIFLIMIPLSILFFLATDKYDNFRNVFTMLLLLYLFYLTIYASFKKNKQAYFILFGWFIFVLTGMLMFLSSLGVFSIYKYFPYLIEISFLLEAVIFSIALANKINNLQKEKNKANQKLIKQKKKETKRLEKKVKAKTKDLRKALDEKNTLLQELNHRVKNNMQTIISLIRLQLNDIDDKQLESHLVTIQNRVSAMSHLHELLYKQNDFTEIKTQEYFSIIINELRDSYDSNVEIDLSIQTNLHMDEAIYCGLILNELVTNSMKYAFTNISYQARIDILLYKKNKSYFLEIKDNGIGYDMDKSYSSLGLTLVSTLSMDQLDGTFEVHYDQGVHSIVSWKDNE